MSNSTQGQVKSPEQSNYIGNNSTYHDWMEGAAVTSIKRTNSSVSKQKEEALNTAKDRAKENVKKRLAKTGLDFKSAKKNKKLWRRVKAEYRRLKKQYYEEIISDRQTKHSKTTNQIKNAVDSNFPVKRKAFDRVTHSEKARVENPKSYNIQPIKQFRGDTCWLASFNMLYQHHMGNIIVDEMVYLNSKNVKDDVKRMVEEGVKKGFTEEEIKNEIFRDSGDKIDMINDVVAATGKFKHIETKDNYSVDDINKLLINSGPFKFGYWENGEVTIDKNTGRTIVPPNAYAHASVVTGITKDGKLLEVIDPDTGTKVFVDIDWFNKKLQRPGRYYDNKGRYDDVEEDPIVIFEKK